MSLIGPRPVTLEETYEYGDARNEVLSCKPASPAGGRLLTATTPRGEAVNDGLASFDILTS